jgi:hypothetical protein
VTDPNRLAEDGSDFEQLVLLSGRGDAMSEASGRTILAALGLTAPVAAAGAMAVGAKISLVKTAVALLGVGAAGGFALWQSERLSEDPALPVVVSAPVQAPAPVIPRPTLEPVPTTPEQPEKSEPTTQPAQTPRQRVIAKADTLPLELEAIDAARSALARGDHALASRLLDRYAARFPKPRLGAEATVLRIETLAARGDKKSAARLGKAFLARDPNGPYARRVRSLIGASSSPER